MKIQVYVKPVENKGIFKGYANAYVNGITLYNLRIKETNHGLFVEMPSVKNGNEYKQVITGVCKELRSQLTDACKQALESDDHKGVSGKEAKQLKYTVHYLENKSKNKSKLKGIASLTIQEDGMTKSMMTIQNIKIYQNDKNKSLNVILPSKKISYKETTTYYDFIVFDSKTDKFIKGIICKEALKKREDSLIKYDDSHDYITNKKLSKEAQR